ncbi:MAG: hypothetical protein ACW981_07445 [Candidatus Hodarchaeales archaeon]|jgi:hypothetical protein
MRIKGTKNHLIYHRRRTYRIYSSSKCWFLGKRNLLACYNEHDPSRIKHAKGCEKFHQREFFWECKMEMSKGN